MQRRFGDISIDGGELEQFQDFRFRHLRNNTTSQDTELFQDRFKRGLQWGVVNPGRAKCEGGEIEANVGNNIGKDEAPNATKDIEEKAISVYPEQAHKWSVGEGDSLLEYLKRGNCIEGDIFGSEYGQQVILKNDTKRAEVKQIKGLYGPNSVVNILQRVKGMYGRLN